MSVIRRYARAVAEKFQPDKIILFGSHAYGTPHEESDVDLLVVMPCRNQLDQGFKIRCAIEAPFPMDLIVRKPQEMKWRLEEGESFLAEIVSKARSSMKRTTTEWVRKAEADRQASIRLHRGTYPLHDVVCFHGQQYAEKYLKGLMEEAGLSIPKTHELTDLRPHHPSLGSLRRGLQFLTHFAVETRYPGDSATRRQATSALRWAGRVRTTVRALLGIRPRPRKPK
jgi:HEPN domain-containing protein/predicted nucleotidyltransferase